jgi:prolyl-tRNA synthetase
MAVKILDENGKAITPTMGSYGIGITRIFGLLAENYHDESGLIWPKAVAPAVVHLVVVSKDAQVLEKALNFAAQLAELGVEVFVDDRKASPGVKFKDAQLLGCPLIVVFGRGFEGAEADCEAEVQIRQTAVKQNVPFNSLLENILAQIEELR